MPELHHPLPTKKCGRCKQVKPVDQFSRDASKAGGYQSYCRDCAGVAKRTIVYGISSSAHALLLSKQGHACAICGQKESVGRSSSLQVDHCHTTKMVRGLLCNYCNTGLGQFKDNIGYLFRAIGYLLGVPAPTL